MKAFLLSLVVLVAVSIAAMLGLDALDRSAARTYSVDSTVRL